MTPLAIALKYIERGWAPVPIKSGEKGPTIKKWDELAITRENAGKFFNGAQQNIGIQLGPKSGGLCDVDLDCPEAVTLAPSFLPRTAAIFGRKSKSRSHYLYRVGDPEPKAAIRFEDVEKGAIIELRLGGGGKAAQTVFPGSKHPSGEIIEWDQDGEPADASCAALKLAITKIALGVIIIRRWGNVGRHEAALRLGGFLARAGWAQDDIAYFIETVARAAGDDEIADRRKAVLDASEAHARGDNTYGLPSIKEHFGDAVGTKIASMLGHREVDTDATLEQMNNKYCLVPYGGKVRILTFEHDGERELAAYYSASDFRLLHSNKLVPGLGKKGPVPLGSWWLNHNDRRQYDGVIFAPGEPSVVNGRLLNLWRGWGIAPREGDWSLLKKHIIEILADGDKAHAEYILNWSAWSFQNPGTPPEVALVCRGGKGTGKGLFGRAMRRAFGQHGLQISSHEHLTGNFNRHLQDCALLFADEAFWPGDKSAEGTLKRIITEPELFITPKGVDGRSEKNRLYIIIAANADWVVPASLDERRYAAFNASEKRKQDRAYFVPLYRELDGGGIAAMMHELLALDMKGWHPRDDVPKTAALIEQKEQSLPPKDQWWIGLLREGILPQADTSNPRRAPSAALFENARATVPKLKFASDHELGRALGERGCGRVKVSEGRGWQFPPLADARKAWAERIPTEWDDDDRDWVLM